MNVLFIYFKLKSLLNVVLPGFMWVALPLPTPYVMYTSYYKKESNSFNCIRVKELNTLGKRFQYCVIIIP